MVLLTILICGALGGIATALLSLILLVTFKLLRNDRACEAIKKIFRVAVGAGACCASGALGAAFALASKL